MKARTRDESPTYYFFFFLVCRRKSLRERALDCQECALISLSLLIALKWKSPAIVWHSSLVCDGKKEWLVPISQPLFVITVQNGCEGNSCSNQGGICSVSHKGIQQHSGFFPFRSSFNLLIHFTSVYTTTSGQMVLFKALGAFSNSIYKPLSSRMDFLLECTQYVYCVLHIMINSVKLKGTKRHQLSQ